MRWKFSDPGSREILGVVTCDGERIDRVREFDTEEGYVRALCLDSHSPDQERGLPHEDPSAVGGICEKIYTGEVVFHEIPEEIRRVNLEVIRQDIKRIELGLPSICRRCEKEISAGQAFVYRCFECGSPFHLACIRIHSWDHKGVLPGDKTPREGDKGG